MRYRSSFLNTLDYFFNKRKYSRKILQFVLAWLGLLLLFLLLLRLLLFNWLWIVLGTYNEKLDFFIEAKNTSSSTNYTSHSLVCNFWTSSECHSLHHRLPKTRKHACSLWDLLLGWVTRNRPRHRRHACRSLGWTGTSTRWTWSETTSASTSAST